MLRAAHELPRTLRRQRPLRSLCWSILVTTAVVSGASGLYVRGQLASRRSAEEQKLLAIADLKAREVERWSEALERHAASIARSERVVSAVEELRGEFDADAEARRAAVLDELLQPERYETARLLSLDGALLASSGDPREALPAGVSAIALDALASRRFEVGQLVPDGADLRVVTAVPLNDASGSPIAAIVLDGPAEATVLHDVRRWPVPSATGEIRIVRSSPSSGVLSSGSDAPTSPVTLARLGARGAVHAEEADGRSVLAAIRPIGATGWALVASVATAEVDQPIWSLAAPVSTIAVALVVAASTALALAARRRAAEIRAREADVAHEQLVVTAELAASMAHQLNSPLASVLANARFALAELRGGNVDVDEATEALTDAVEATQRVAAVVRSLQSLPCAQLGRGPAQAGADAADAGVSLRRKVA